MGPPECPAGTPADTSWRCALAKGPGLGHSWRVARSFRLVCDTPEIPLVEALLASQGFVSTPEPFSPWCRELLDEPFPLGASLAARFGLIYIQDRSSMLPPLALAPPPGAAVLDMCASPGGKTSFLAQLAGRSGYVLGNEPGGDRLATLRQNLARMNLPQAVTTGMKGQDLPLPVDSFGHILLDPPCSGWGTVEKNPKVLDLWKPDKVEPLIALQRELLAKAAGLLAPGGRLLYSTCTTNRAENEEQAVWAAQELGLQLTPLAPFPGFSFHDPHLPGAAGTLRVDGESSQAQGFYLALFVKPGETGSPPGMDEAGETGGGRADGMTAAAPDGQAVSDLAGPDAPSVGASRKRASKRSGRSQDRTGGTHGHKIGSPGPRGPETELPASALDDPGLDFGGLPPGFYELFKDDLCFLPERGRELLPPRRKGQRLGSVKGGVFRPWGRARLLLPPSGSAGESAALDVEEPETISALLEGRSIQVATRAVRMGLYFRGLPLGFLTVKGGRALWSDR